MTNLANHLGRIFDRSFWVCLLLFAALGFGGIWYKGQLMEAMRAECQVDGARTLVKTYDGPACIDARRHG